MAKKGLKERLLQKQQDMKDRSKGGKYESIKEGTMRARPAPVPPDTEFAVEATVFYMGKKGFIISPKTFGEKCGIYEEYNRLQESKNEADRSFASKMRPNTKYFIPHVFYKDDKGKEIDEEKGVKLLICASGVYNELIDLFLDDEAGDFTDPENGYDIKYKRVGKGKTDTEYFVSRCNPTRLKKFKKPVDPVEMVKAITPSYKETKTIIAEFLSMSEDAEETEEAAPKKKKKKRDI